jgi:hypothetical protein
MTDPVTAFNDEVVDISLDILANLRLEYHPSHSGEGWACIFQTFRHPHETESSKRCDEDGFFLVLLRHPTLMVAGKTIQ